MVEPSFLALTSTPSIAPSSAEETWPLSDAAVWACAGTKVRHASTLTRLVDASRALNRMVISLAGLFHCQMNCPNIRISEGRATGPSGPKNADGRDKRACTPVFA